jgi:putative membrane protein
MAARTFAGRHGPGKISMKCVSWCVVAVAAALWAAGGAQAQTQAADANGNTRGAARESREVPTSPRTAAKSTMFAPAAAASARRLEPQQLEERRFLKSAAAASRFQADAGRVALLKSSDAAVRSLAATLVNQQYTSGNELMWLLHQRGMAAPMLDNDQRKTLNRLAKLKGRKFDREFIDQVGVRSQESEIGSYEKAGLVAGDPAIKGWIDRTLPSLRAQAASAGRIVAGSL